MSNDEIRQMHQFFAGSDELRDQLVAECETREGVRRVRQSAVLEYYCRARRNCLLLLVWQVPGGLLFYQPRYRLAAGFNLMHSNAAGRARNTLDGDRAWKAQAGVLDGRYRDLSSGGGLILRCRHVSRLVSGNELLDIAATATPGDPTRRFL